MDRTLVYARAGVAFGDVSSTVRLGGVEVLRGSETHVGWTAGLGLEHALSNHLTFRIEYAHVDLGSEAHSMKNVALGPIPAGVFGVKSDVDVTVDTINVGVSYKF